MSFHLKGTHEVVTKGGGLTIISRPVEALPQPVDHINTQNLVFLFKTLLNLRCFVKARFRII